MMTVLPTPAPPKTPILPPFANGQTRSMTLMPVSKISVDRQALARGHRALLVDRFAQNVEDAAEGHLADRHRDWAARVGGVDAAGEAVRSGHGHAADPVVAEVLLDFADDHLAVAAADFHGVVDRGKPAGREFDVDDRTRDLNHAAGGRAGCGLGGCRHRAVVASCGRGAIARRTRSRSIHG
jgi:hypothetical protein